MYRFLFRPRWIAGHVLLIVTVVTFVNLGLWQFRRLDERQTYNARATQRLAAGPVSLDAARSGASADDLDLRRVTVEGSYVGEAQVLTAPRTVDGRPGQQVLSVLERADGPAVLVDRGWIPFDRTTLRAPPVPDGRVRITGVARAREPDDIGNGAQVLRIVPAQIAARLGRPLLPFYVQLRSQEPATGTAAPRPTPLPELTEGNHRSYAIQWFTFALIALIGYPVLAWRTAHQDGPPGPPDGAGRTAVTVGSNLGR